MIDAYRAQENYDIFRFCYENGHDEWIRTASRCFDFYRGRQWEEADLAFLRAAGRPALTFNTIEALVRAMKGIQRAMRNDVRYIPIEDADAAAAKVRDQLWLHVQNQNHLDFVETEIWERGLVMGRAFYDIRMRYNDNLQGDIVVKPLRSQDVVLDPAIDSYDPDDWPQVFHTRWVSLNDIEFMYGKAAADSLSYTDLPQWYMYEDQLMAVTLSKNPYFRYTGVPDPRMIRAYRILDRQYREVKLKEVFIDTNSGETSEIPENWDRDRIANLLSKVPGISTIKRKMNTIRWRTTCENQVLHDEDSPYNHFTIVPFFPTFLDGLTMGPVESLLDPQMLFNKVTSQELQIINTTANSGYKLKRGSLTNMTIEELEKVGSRPGFVAELKEIADLEKFQPNQVPQGHDRISFKADKIMRDLAGVPNQVRGYAREDVAGEAIEQNQAANDINWAAYLANLHRTKQMLAVRANDLFQTYYTEERMIQITSGSVYAPQVSTVTINQMTPEGEIINDISRGKFTTVLVPAPSRATMSEGEFQQMLELKQLGVQIPDSVLIELSGAPNKAQILDQLGGDSSQQAQAQAQMEQELHQLQMQLMQAQVADANGRAQLAEARANKANAEASRDPDQAAMALEQQRSQTQRDIAVLQSKIEVLKERMKSRSQDQKTAVELTKIRTQAETAKATAKTKATAASKKPKPTSGTKRKKK